MNLIRHTIIGLALVGLVCLWPTQSAYAYLDPGTGSYILQMIIAAGLGSLLTLKIFGAKIKRSFKRLFGKGNEIDNLSE